MKTEEGNRLISEFMGIVYDKPNPFWDQEQRYHSSWDWLMPVVEKIGSTDISSIDIHWGTGCTDSFAWCDINWGDGINTFTTSDKLNNDEQSLIKAVWLACIEFIKWYNKNGKT